ncbi:hypothetical protein [Candidatus Nitrosocosmicus sp. FF01]|jgi:hypothetical protein|uniref:hypothetical protein n=1 Tax=Candidatus Nitrosocosmicus sp. FF01 TaxID=3397670 RepID=UPI0039E836BD
MSLNEVTSVTDLIRCVKCDKEGLNLCQICGGVFCNDHSAFLERDEDYVDQKCLYCYEASLTDSNSLY